MNNNLPILKLALIALCFVSSFSCGRQTDSNQSKITANPNNSAPANAVTPKPLPEVYKVNWGGETYETSACRERLGHPATMDFTVYEFKADGAWSRYAFINDKKAVYGDLDGDGSEEAVVGIVCGSRDEAHPEMIFEVQIFSAENKKKKFLARLDQTGIEKDQRKTNPKSWVLGLHTIEVKDGQLVLKITTYDSNTSDYDSKTNTLYMSTFVYKLDNGNFVLEGKPARARA